jgi:hypothetical protein
MRAYARFSAVLNDPEHLVQLRLKPGLFRLPTRLTYISLRTHSSRCSVLSVTGEIATFNQRRVLHGRTAFHSTAGGMRHLQGAYVNIDEFKSALSVLAVRFGKPLPGSVGNADLAPVM